MRKKVLLLILLLCFASPTISFASTITPQVNSNVRIAIFEDVMKDVIKNTLYNIGTQVLNKYANPYNYNYNNYNNNSNNNNNQNNNSNDVIYNTNNDQQGVSPGDYIPDQDHPPEDMIPIS